MTDLTTLADRVREATWRQYRNLPYDISDSGLVRSRRTGAVMRPAVSKKGYATICMSVDKARTTLRLGRAVAEVFIGPIPPGMQVNHIDGNKLNNAVENLEIVSNQENQNHASRTDLKAGGERNGQSKLTAAQVSAIKQSKSTSTVLAKEYGVDSSLIRQIKRGVIWQKV